MQMTNKISSKLKPFASMSKISLKYSSEFHRYLKWITLAHRVYLSPEILHPLV